MPVNYDIVNNTAKFDGKLSDNINFVDKMNTICAYLCISVMVNNFTENNPGGYHIVSS